MSFAAIMSVRSALTAPAAVLSFPGREHTCVSCPHGTPWPKSDFPNRASLSDTESGGIYASMSALLRTDGYLVMFLTQIGFLQRSVLKSNVTGHPENSAFKRAHVRTGMVELYL